MSEDRLPQVHIGAIASGEKITASDLGHGNEPQWTEAALNPPLELRPYPHLDGKLRSGKYYLHAFCSGGGLRVVHLDYTSEEQRRQCNIGYGEHPNLEPALALAEVDCAEGGRDYHEVYGVITPHFYTGTTTSSSALDRWVLMGRSFDVRWTGEMYEWVGEYYHQEKAPKGLVDGIIATYKEATQFLEEYRVCPMYNSQELVERLRVLNAGMRATYQTNVTGKTHTIEITPYVFPSGEVGTIWKILDRAEGDLDPFFFKTTKRITGGLTLQEHLNLVNQELERWFKEQGS